MQVTYFHRRRRPNANFSIELIFENLRRDLHDKIEARVCIAPVYSNGLIRRAWIAVYARLHSGEVNHVTGDINFVAIFLPRARTVVTIHDCSFIGHVSGVHREFIRLFWVKFPARLAKVVTTVSENAKAEIVRLSGCDPLKVVVIPNAISESFKSFPKSELSNPPRLLQIGTAINKNLIRLIKSLAGLPCVLAIVGAIEDDVRAELAEQKVRYENYLNLDQTAVIEQYRLADVVTFVSTCEGFGMPIVEAQTIGRPVVTSNLSSMPDVAGGAACLVDPYDVASIRAGIEKVLHDNDYRQELIHRGLQNVNRFDGRAIANRYLEIYNQVLNTNAQTK